MSILSRPYFHDETAAFAFLESVIWPESPVCVKCGSVERITRVKANPEKRIRVGLHRCANRFKLGCEDAERATWTSAGVVGKRLTYCYSCVR